MPSVSHIWAARGPHGALAKNTGPVVYFLSLIVQMIQILDMHKIEDRVRTDGITADTRLLAACAPHEGHVATVKCPKRHYTQSYLHSCDWLSLAMM